jgi:hypothetical protein
MQPSREKSCFWTIAWAGQYRCFWKLLHQGTAVVRLSISTPRRRERELKREIAPAQRPLTCATQISTCLVGPTTHHLSAKQENGRLGSKVRRGEEDWGTGAAKRGVPPAGKQARRAAYGRTRGGLVPTDTMGQNPCQEFDSSFHFMLLLYVIAIIVFLYIFRVVSC